MSNRVRPHGSISESPTETRTPQDSASELSTGSFWNLLLLIPYLGLLCVPLYARISPSFVGLPFFYWYQFLWVFITMGLIALVGYRTR